MPPPLPAAEPPIPVYLGALGERMLELAGEIADGVILNYPTVTTIAGSVAAIERGIARAGRARADVRILAFLRTVIDHSYEAASAPIKDELLAYFMAPVYQRVFTADGYGDDCEAFVARWMRVLAAPPDGIAAAERRRCTHAAAVLGELREAAALEPPDAIVERALALTGFEAAWAPLRGGEQALANVRKLVAILRTLAGRSIDEAVAYLHRRRDELADREGPGSGRLAPTGYGC